MLSIAIISDLHDWHSREIESTLQKKGHKVIKLRFDELQGNFRKGKFFLNQKFYDLLMGQKSCFIANRIPASPEVIPGCQE